MGLRVALSPFCWTMFVFLSMQYEVHHAAPSGDLIPKELLLVPHELCEGQADPQPSMGLGRVFSPGILASWYHFILNLLFSLFFTGLFKDSSPNPVRDNTFLPKQCIGRVFSGGQGVVNCGWQAIILSAGGRLF